MLGCKLLVYVRPDLRCRISEDSSNATVLHESLKPLADTTMNDRGTQLLHDAIHRADYDTACLLIQIGWNISAEEDPDDFLLILEAKPQNKESKSKFLKFLLKLNLDINSNDKYNMRNPLHHAAVWCQDEHYMCTRFAPLGLELDFNSWNATDVTKWFVKQGCKIYEQDINGCTPLMLASYVPEESLAAYVENSLLNYGVEYYIGGNSNMMCLHFAAMQHRLDDVKKCVHHGCDVTIQSCGVCLTHKLFKGTSLHFAAARGHKKIVSCLLHTLGANSFLIS